MRNERKSIGTEGFASVFVGTKDEEERKFVRNSILTGSSSTWIKIPHQCGQNMELESLMLEFL